MYSITVVIIHSLSESTSSGSNVFALVIVYYDINIHQVRKTK